MTSASECRRLAAEYAAGARLLRLERRSLLRGVIPGSAAAAARLLPAVRLLETAADRLRAAARSADRPCMSLL
jgi:hypothetical protein